MCISSTSLPSAVKYIYHMAMQQVIQHIHGICPTEISLRCFCERYVFFCRVVYIYMHYCEQILVKDSFIVLGGKKKKKILKFEMAFSSYEFHSLFESIPKKRKDISEWCSVKGPLI